MQMETEQMRDNISEGFEKLIDSGYFSVYDPLQAKGKKIVDLWPEFESVGDNKLIVTLRKMVRHPEVGELVNKFEIEVRKLV